MKLRRVYIKKVGDELASEACYTAWRGFDLKGYPLDFFEWDDLKQERLVLDRNTLVVGGTTTIHAALQQIGVSIPPPLNLPTELGEYLGRKVWTTTVGEVRSSSDATPVFVKPLHHSKLFAGMVLDRDNRKKLDRWEADLPLMASDPITFVSEWRYFIHNRSVIGLAHYRGDWACVPESDLIRRAVADYESAPMAYALDFGVVEGGRSLLIEANDAYALGAFGLDAGAYTTMLEDRWLEIVDS